MTLLIKWEYYQIQRQTWNIIKTLKTISRKEYGLLFVIKQIFLDGAYNYSWTSKAKYNSFLLGLDEK